MMTNKTKQTQPETSKEIQGRDLFQTPRYATNILIPFIPKNIKCIWECSSGEEKISNVLLENKYNVFATDLNKGSEYDFLSMNFPLDSVKDWVAIVTNPPFSLKKKFIERAFYHDVPFAFLIPFDMSGFLCECFMKRCQGLVPTRRIDYITPSGRNGKESASQFHSFWLTYKFDLPDQLTFVELTNEMKKEI
jgi:hypothetical protein